MSTGSDSISKKRRTRTRNLQHNEPTTDGLQPDTTSMASAKRSLLQDPMALTTSLDSVYVTPRTPRTPYGSSDPDLTDGVEMSLLNEEQQREAMSDMGSSRLNGVGFGEVKKPMSSKDRVGIALLCVLYLIQGVPIGLALGSVPFLLREHLSYSQLGTFALSSYPYSLKLLWSPIVDSVFFSSVGRRKSWIIPMQLVVGSIMLYISLNVEALLTDPSDHIYQLTFLFTSLVFFSATQDIAVDGWALTLLSPENLSYASTCQTVGLNTGYFASFTVFLALNSETFTTKWGIPHLTLSAYLRFWSVVCYLVTGWLAFFKKEDREINDDDMGVAATYKTIWEICKLKHVQQLIIIHLFAKIGFAANEAVSSLKMVEKGLGREDLAIAVLIDFPFQMVGGWLTARWSRGEQSLSPWIWAFIPRLVFSIIAPTVVYFFPTPPISFGFFAFLVLNTVLQSFTSTVQFVGMNAFHARISDPLIGGTYMTLLNTFSNMGGTFPKWFVLQGVDLFSIATCKVVEAGEEVFVQANECVSDHGKAQCAEINGTCVTERDGYYIVSAICVTIGAVVLLAFILPTARKLQGLTVSKWRVKMS